MAQAVGVTPPSIYLHFADRNELIFAVCEEQFGHLHEAMDSAGAGVEDPWERIQRKGRAYIQFGLDNPEQYRILFTSRPDSTPERFMDERLIATTAFGRLMEDIDEVRARGLLRPDAPDTTVIACGLWMTVHGVTSLLIAKPEFPWPDRQLLIDHALVTCAAGLRGVAPAEEPSGR